MNKWWVELEGQEQAFLEQATKVNAWDKVLIENGQKVTRYKTLIKILSSLVFMNFLYITVKHFFMSEGNANISVAIESGSTKSSRSKNDSDLTIAI